MAANLHKATHANTAHVGRSTESPSGPIPETLHCYVNAMKPSCYDGQECNYLVVSP